MRERRDGKRQGRSRQETKYREKKQISVGYVHTYIRKEAKNPGTPG